MFGEGDPKRTVSKKEWPTEHLPSVALPGEDRRVWTRSRGQLPSGSDASHSGSGRRIGVGPKRTNHQGKKANTNRGSNSCIYKISSEVHTGTHAHPPAPKVAFRTVLSYFYLTLQRYDTSPHEHSLTHARTHPHTHKRTHARTHKRTHARTHTNARMRAYARTHTHTHTHTRTHN